MDLGFGASWALNYSLGGHASTFEFGGRFRNEHKLQNLDTRSYLPIAASGDAWLRMTNFLGGFTDPNYYGGSYKFGPTVEYARSPRSEPKRSTPPTPPSATTSTRSKRCHPGT